jgi:2-polyprenyl-3-methyl-5-hydroxy-6-metoxy-1,4-benzoquinol methylase
MDASKFYEDYWRDRKSRGAIYFSAPQRVKRAVHAIDSHNPNTILDVECGDGILAKTLPEDHEIYGCVRRSCQFDR